MMVPGFTSSILDYMTFGNFALPSSGYDEQSRTGWFTESVISISLIVLVIRSEKPFSKSTPGKYQLTTTLIIGGLTLYIPNTLIAALFGFKHLPLPVLLIIGGVIGLYIFTAEAVKRIFYKKVKFLIYPFFEFTLYFLSLFFVFRIYSLFF